MAETIIGRRAYLKYDNFVADNTPGGRWDEGFAGYFNRDVGVGFTLETFLEFNVAPFFGQVAGSVVLEADFGVQGTQPSTQPWQVYEQNKEPSITWISNFRSPWYDDMAITPWSNGVLLGDGTYPPINNPPTETLSLQAGRLLTLVNAWLAQTKDWKDGVVLTSHTGSVDWWTQVLEVRIILDGLTLPASSLDHTTARGIRVGIENGIL